MVEQILVLTNFTTSLCLMQTVVSAISEVTLETDLQTNIILGIASSSNGFNLNVPLILIRVPTYLLFPLRVSRSTELLFQMLLI